MSKKKKSPEEEPMKYYNSKHIREKHAHYNVVFGERSNGKTYDVLYHSFEDFIDSGEINQLAIIRRWDEDFKGENTARTCYKSLMCDANGMNQIKILSKGKYDGVVYYSGQYYCTIMQEDGTYKRTDRVCAVGFALTQQEHYKSGAFPHIQTIMFDEFLTRGMYLPDEFIIFQNVISTIIRKESNDVQIWMLGNTVNKYSPYYRDMGLYRINSMKKGDIDLYQYGDSGLRVAVEYSDSPSKKAPTDVYFAFDNPRLKMITGGDWEIDIYPHAPKEPILKKQIKFIFFIKFMDQILQCEVVERKNEMFLFIHLKTTPIRDEDHDLIYQVDHDPRENYRRKITECITNFDRKILWFFTADKVFYQDNEVGEIVRNYLNWCKTSA